MCYSGQIQTFSPTKHPLTSSSSARNRSIFLERYKKFPTKFFKFVASSFLQLFHLEISKKKTFHSVHYDLIQQNKKKNPNFPGQASISLWINKQTTRGRRCSVHRTRTPQSGTRAVGLLPTMSMQSFSCCLIARPEDVVFDSFA